MIRIKSVRFPWLARWIALLGVLACWNHSSQSDDKLHDLQVASEALQVREGYRITAVASEPLVVDPVSARLDHRGRLWVVEMPDYPTGPRDRNQPAGRIKILRDTDSDRRFDAFTMFAEGLVFATGVQPFRDGAFVTLAGKILFMRDRDNDGVADESTLLFEGFAQQNEQLRANHPTLGPGGMIYVAGGLRGGSIQAVDARYQPRDKPLDLRDRDFRFDPEGGPWGAVAGKSQFGVTIDDFGRRFGCSNRNPAMTTPLSLAATERDPLLAARDTIWDVALAAEKSKVVSRAEAWTTSNLHSGQFSAACGVFAPGIRDSIGEWLLVCEPTAYLVQRQRISLHDSVWVSRRESMQAEFLSSSDPWFRPVDVTAGPGQSIYVVDMARAVIEHPDFMPPELKSRPDMSDGDSLGRIWHVAPIETDTKLQPLPSADDALLWLESPSPWQRQMATQFLLEDNSPLEERLGEIVLSESASPPARARSALLLERKQQLSSEQLRRLMTADDPRLRALAVRLSAPRRKLVGAVLAMSSDRDLLVLRHVAAFAADKANHWESRISALAEIALATDDFWIRRSIASVHCGLTLELARRLAASESANSELLSHLIERSAVSSPLPAAEVVARLLVQANPGSPLETRRVDALEAWVSGARKGRRSVSKSLSSLPSAPKTALLEAFQAAAATALDDSFSPSIRARCLGLSVAGGQAPQNLRKLVTQQSPSLVRAAALPVLLQREPDWTHSYLRQNLTAMTIPLRSAAIGVCSRRVSDAKWLLSEIASGSLPKTLIDPATAKRLRQHSNIEIRREAERLLRADPNRAKVLATFALSARNLGDALLGRKLFAEHCAACHHIDGVGTNVGPDISDTRTKTPEALLTSILDPNAAIDSSFIQHNVLTLDGRIIDGLLIDETSDAMTLQQKGGKRVRIPRDDIETIQAPGVSLMPEGFEQVLDAERMSHLLSYLKNWRYLATSIPGTLSGAN